eukprot:3254527-Prymnesium_polylepis.3
MKFFAIDSRTLGCSIPCFTSRASARAPRSPNLLFCQTANGLYISPPDRGSSLTDRFNCSIRATLTSRMMVRNFCKPPLACANSSAAASASTFTAHNNQCSTLRA